MVVLLMCLVAEPKFDSWELNRIVFDVLESDGKKYHKRVAIIRKQMMAMPVEELREFFILNLFRKFYSPLVFLHLTPPVHQSRQLKDRDKEVLAFAIWVVNLHRSRNVDWLFLKRRNYVQRTHR